MEIIGQIEEGIQFKLLHTYGMSEVGSMLLLREPPEPLETRIQSGGKPVSGKVKIIDPDTLMEVPEGERGEIVVSGFNVMTRYYNAPDKTTEAFLDDGYFRTGDIGVKHPDGIVEYHGRLREALRLSGFLVSPAEIEDFINELEGVELSQVVGVNHNQKVTVAAFVILKEGSTLTVEEMQNHCQSLAYFKRPRHFFIVEDFPTTPGPNGEKIVRNKLVEIAKSMVVSQI
jgi:fatty-acyl-CoA synthase